MLASLPDHILSLTKLFSSDNLSTAKKRYNDTATQETGIGTIIINYANYYIHTP